VPSWLEPVLGRECTPDRSCDLCWACLLLKTGRSGSCGTIGVQYGYAEYGGLKYSRYATLGVGSKTDVFDTFLGHDMGICEGEDGVAERYRRECANKVRRML